MLVITRKPQQDFLIGDNIRIIVVAIRQGQVRIGIEAPKDVRIMRTELLTGKEKSHGQERQ
jgi:carbon storage regulator